MKNIILNKPQNFEYIETDQPVINKPDEVLLKVHRIGICGTDLHAYAGEQPFFSYPRILGHELGVEVVKTGNEVTNISVGEKCSVEPYRFTHSVDPAVKRGKPNCAEHLSVLGVHEDGGMREYFTFPAKYLHSSKELTYDQLALVEPLAIGCHAVNRANVTSNDDVMVIGSGPIGLGAIQFAKAAGARVIVMEIDNRRLEFCKQNIKVDAGVNPGDTHAEEQIRQVFNENLPNIVFDATGNKASMENAFNYVAHGGCLVYIGLFQGDVTFHDPDFHKKELTLMASRNALGSDFDQIIKAIEQGKIDTTPWITHRAKFSEMIEKFSQWLDPDSNVIIKAVTEL